MNNKVSQVMKFIACAAVIAGAPFLASVAVYSAITEVDKTLEIAACQRAAALDKITKECK